MEFTKKQTINRAVDVVADLKKVFKGLMLNGTVCLPANKKNAIKGCFLANARDLIMGATRQQLEKAYDEVSKTGLKDEEMNETFLEEVFKTIGNKAENPGNEKLIETVWFGDV